MLRMTRFLKISLVGVWGAVAMLAMVYLYALFHGYFDHSEFEIKQFQWSSAGQVAMLVERSDNEALGGLDDYALVGDHLFTPAELRHAYHSDAVIFSALSDCLSLRWDGPNRLAITCSGSTVDRGHINSQKQQIGNIAISYENIAIK